MNEKKLTDLSRIVKKTVSYKPNKPPTKPKNEPSKKELERVYMLNIKTLKIK